MIGGAQTKWIGGRRRIRQTPKGQGDWERAAALRSVAIESAVELSLKETSME